MKADRIIKGGSFFTGKQNDRTLDFVAIKGNRILATGTDSEMSRYIDDNTLIDEFDKNKLIMPGIHDNHVHVMQAAMMGKYADLFSSQSEAEAVGIIKAYADEHPEDGWIIGFGWSKFAFKKLPTKESLDRMIPDRPVILLDDELHSAWVNSAALSKAGITSKTSDPPYGKIGRDENGEATGFLYETALCLAAEKAFDFSNEKVKELVNEYIDTALSFGITSITDMTPYLGIDLSHSEVFLELAEKGELGLRINAALDLFKDIHEVLELKEKAEEKGRGMYRIPFLKQFIDGIVGNYTAMMLNDYSDKPGDKGGCLLDLDRMNDAIAEAHRNDMSVRLHAIGDAAIRAALDGFEKAIKQYGKTKSRHQIEHIEVIDPADIKRFGELGVIASVQPEHIVSGMPSFSVNNYPEILGKTRERFTWVFKSLLDSGAVLAGGSDCPVVKGNPFIGMYSGMERVHDDGTPKGGWNPSEKIGIETLLQMYTYNAAYGEGREEELGLLEPGQLADLIVVDRNLTEVSSEEVRDAKVLMTVVDGIVRYRAN